MAPDVGGLVAEYRFWNSWSGSFVEGFAAVIVGIPRLLLIYVGVALIAAGIAILGNQLGRKVGRKKLTIFNLRPRHTSILFTAMTGVFIALATLSLAALVSVDVREALTGVQGRLEELKKKEKVLSEYVDELDSKVQTGAIVWRYEEPIALTTVLPNSDADGILTQIYSTLEGANLLSLQSNNQIAVERNMPTFPASYRMLEFDVETVRILSRELSDRDKAVGVRIAAARNCLYGDQVPVLLQSFEVTKVFRNNEVLVSDPIDPGNTLYEWYQFLDHMKQVALRRGMIEINDSLGGGLTATDLRRISTRVQSMGAPVYLSAIANRDIYESSRLDIRIEVTKERYEAGQMVDQ